MIDLCHKVQLAYNENLKDLQQQGMLPLFDAGYINIARQYLTIGINGLVEAAEFMGLEINDNPKYKNFVVVIGESARKDYFEIYYHYYSYLRRQNLHLKVYYYF